MNAKHTPGPWKVVEDFIDEQQSLDYMSVISCDAEIASRIRVDADARLIAAAPELLAAALEFMNGEGNVKATRDMFRAAIAKATGA